MDLARWLSTFRALHEKAKARTLDDIEGRDYQAGREELARALVAAQGLTRQPDQSPRRMLRVARLLQVDVESRVRMERITTTDISLGGFSARMARAPAPDEELTATLRLPGMEPLRTAVKIVGTKQHPGSVLVSFAFQKLEGSAAERLELAFFDMVLSQMGR
jgi:hypothetical protein